MLDGTADKSLIEALFKQDFESIDIRADLSKNRIIHIKRQAGIGFYKNLIEKNELKTYLTKRLLPIIFKELQGVNSILFCCHKILKAPIKKIIESYKRKNHLSFKFDFIHFKGNRGLNGYKNYQAVVLLSEYLENPLSAE